MTWRKLAGLVRSLRGRVQGFPARSVLTSWGQHLALDSREDEIYWARSRSGRGGLRLLEWGRVASHEAEGRYETLREIAMLPWVRCAYVEVPIRSPELRHKRVELPTMASSQAHKVGERRAADFMQEQPEGMLGSFMRARGKGAYPLWLVAIPLQAAELFEARWRALGFDVHRLSSESLALGNLARLLPANRPGELSAILDVQQDAADCVVCDDQGWHFNRLIPIRPGRGHGAGGSGEPSAKDDAFSGSQLERIATELQRTFQYVQRELHLGPVTRVAITGQHADLPTLAAELPPRLELDAGLLGDLVPDGPARGIDPGAARAVGLALAPDSRGARLLPPEAKGRHRLRRARLHLVAALVAVSLLSGSLAAGVGLDVYRVRHALAGMDAEMGSNRDRLGIVAQTARTRERARVLQDLGRRLRRPEPPWEGYLELLSRSVPPEIALEELAVARDDKGWSTTLALEAQGDTVTSAAQRVAELRDALARAPLLARVVASRDRSRPTVQEESGARVFFLLSARITVLDPGSMAGGSEGARD